MPLILPQYQIHKIRASYSVFPLDTASFTIVIDVCPSPIYDLSPSGRSQVVFQGEACSIPEKDISGELLYFC